jgi:CRISPR-associated endonuclease/helicase Cas3
MTGKPGGKAALPVILRAKSAADELTGEPPSILEHCREVRAAAEAVWEAIKDALAEATGIELSTLERELRPLYVAAALLHDLGKANSAFQAILPRDSREKLKQPVRHEILGAFLLSDPDYLGAWFRALRDEKDVWTIIWAVAGHHLKMGDPARGKALFTFGGAAPNVTVALADGQVAELLRETAAALTPSASVPKASDVKFVTVDDDDDSLEERVGRFAETSARVWNRLRRDGGLRQRVALLKALLIAADIAGSARPVKGTPVAQWVRDGVTAGITKELLEPVVQEDHKGKPRKFQLDVAASKDRATVVVAGCGNGKTTAAYMWAQKQAVGRKLWFTYPTTGTASAGFEDYILKQRRVTSALIHGRALVDIQAMLGTKEDDRVEEYLRRESLMAWNREVIVCTVDTVLGLMQNQKRPLFSYPAIARGAFVFDEIHSYDARLFGALLRFLEVFPGVPVLLMSASIPPARLDKLREVLGKRFSDVIPGDAKLEGYERYRVERRDSAEACRQEVIKAIREGQKVLWVGNTVSDAVEMARSAREWAGVKPLIYHSRFQYRHRVERQQEVIKEFEYEEEEGKRHLRKKRCASLVVATQVCEMSLDISADLMVTAMCPLPSLVQRLGRLNRYASGADPWPCLVYPFEGNPYNERPEFIQTRGDFRAGMRAARKAVDELAGKPCSQRELADRLKAMTEAEEFETYSAWLDDGWLTEPAAVREGDASVTLIREEDLAEIRKQLGPEHARPSKWTSRALVPWTIPMLYRKGFHAERRAAGYPVAPSGGVAYSEEEGATWQTNTK